ncbi:Transposable element P transposase [Paramuricea clavata]|uniref:Transposable element P transposase n=1 Tax=Paramuricea clavata TaxID=317549 RepID=A0A6S7J279_PARCT|nr:Transposable element P transposase [Paramuricea clavata]
MPGSNCAFYGCYTSRKSKISRFKIPVVCAADSDHTKAFKTKARQEWIALILRTREMTPELKQQIDANNIHFCELHFKPECFNIHPKRKTLISGSVPSENLQTSSHSPEETPSKVVKAPSLESVIQQVQDSIPPWKLDNSPDNGVKLELYDDLHSLPKYTVLIHSSLEFTVAVYNWPIKEDHPIYKELKRSVMYHSMCELVNIIEESSLCQGLPEICCRSYFKSNNIWYCFMPLYSQIHNI